MVNKRKKGFTLVELLAVIVILAIILVIAVPQIMSTIKDTTKASLESSAKMVAAQVEKEYTVAQTLGKEFNATGSCMKDWAGLNDVDYESCTYEIGADGNAIVTLVGKGKFKDLNICGGTKSSAMATEDACLEATSAEYFDYETVYYVKAGSNCVGNVPDDMLCNFDAILSMVVNSAISSGEITIDELVSQKIVADVQEVIEITGYDDSNGPEIIIPRRIDGKSVYGIGDSVFKGHVITNIEFPNTLRYIGSNAVYGSKSNDPYANNDEYAPDTGVRLTGVLDLSDLVNLEFIGENAFYHNGITEVKLPSSLILIGNEAFGYNSISGELDLSNTKLTIIGTSVFLFNQITSVKLPASIASISERAFDKSDDSNPDLTKIINPSGNSFDWNTITQQGTSDTCTFATGTCGSVTIKAS